MDNSKIDGRFSDFGQVKNRLSFCWLWASEDFLQNFLRKSWMPMQPLLFNYLMRRHPVFLFTSLSQHSQLGYLWLPTPHCAALVWLTGHHGIPLVAKCFQPNPYLGKQKISLGMASILRMCLCSHTKLDYNQLLTI